MREIHYRIRWFAAGRRPGQHRSRSPGAGYEFRGHAPLLRELDARRLDVHASLRDPFGYAAGLWQVRTFNQRSAIRVVVLADLSASMSADGTRRKMALLADFTATLAYSASRAGDPFGFFGADAKLLHDFVQVPSQMRGAGLRIAERLRGHASTGIGVEGLIEAAHRLGRARALVFLASDFHFDAATTDRVLAALAAHAVVPVVLWDEQERTLPAAGFASVVDAESSAKRFLWLRPALRARYEQSLAGRRAALARRLTRDGLPPLFLAPPFDADAVSAYFHAPGHATIAEPAQA
ncbi:MAG TPA: MxaS protein [Burkholderiaceae bacterium]|nr:MxaS protein [Burkholderiaceae bacterium]